MGKKAVGYVRVSSKDQADRGESLTTQRKAIKDFIAAHNWKHVKTYSDEGVSGGSVEKRLGLQKLLIDALNKKFDVLVCHRLSRFARNAIDLLNNTKLLKQHGVQFKGEEPIFLDVPPYSPQR